MVFLRKIEYGHGKKHWDTCLLVQKYANDRTASLLQTSFEIHLGFRWWPIHRIILPCKVVGQPSSIIPILIHPLSLDQWDFLIIISHDLHFPGCRSRPSHHTPAQNRLHQILTWPAACCCCSSEQHNLVARQVRWIAHCFGRWWDIALVFAHDELMCDPFYAALNMHF